MVERSIYAQLIMARARAQLSYRLSFTLDLFAQVVAQALELIVILVLFGRIDALGGFSVDEVLLMFGIASISFGMADLMCGQLDDLPNLVRTGRFDTLLLRPLGTLPQMMASDIRLRRVGKALTGFLTFGYAITHADIHWTLWTVLLTVVTPIAGAVILGSVWVVACVLSFWLVESRELANSVTYGSNVFTSYPITVFSGWLRRLLAFVVPGAFVAYYPSLALLGRADPLGAPGWISWIAPLVAAASAVVAGAVWRFAVRHYRGTGS